MGALSPLHWVIIIAVVLLLFGGRLLPRLGRSLGKSLNGLRDGAKEGAEGFKAAVAEDPTKDSKQAEIKAAEIKPAETKPAKTPVV
jgi:sec-independent protein translocase protein TatA